MPTPNLLTSDGSTDNAFTYTTASITPAASRLVLVGVFVAAGISPTPVPTVTGCGLTWELVNQTVPAFRTVHVFRALGTPTAGPLTINFGTGNSPNGCAWTVVEYDGVDTSGTNGSGAIIQSFNAKPAAATSVNVAFAGVPAASSSGFAIIGTQVSESVTPGTGWTADSNPLITPNQAQAGLWATACPSAVTGSWVSSASSWVVGVEIKASGAGGSLNKVRLGSTIAKLYLGTTAIPKAYLGTTQIYP
jgi:hypothetical protein